MTTRWAVLVGLAMLGTAASVGAQNDEEIRLDIQPQILGDALNKWAYAAGFRLISPGSATRRLVSPRLQGTFTPKDALEHLLAGTELTYEFLDDRSVAIHERDSATPPTASQSLNGQQLRLAAAQPDERGASHGSGESGNRQGSNRQRAVLEEVIVTAQKREERVFDVPMSIVALRGEQLEMQGVQNLDDIALTVPGVSILRTGGYGLSQPYMRGMGNTRGANALVGLYLDESSVTASNNYQIDLRTHDLERVEVLRGPQGTLYGEGSMGGTIRFITKEPELDKLGVKGELSASHIEDGSWGEGVKAVLNMPIARDVLGVRVAAVYENAAGWIDQPQLQRSDINDGELRNIRVKGLWQATDDLRIRATGIFHRNEAGATDSGELDRGVYRQAFGRPTTPSGEHEYDFYSVTVDYDLGPVELVSTTGYVDSLVRFEEFGYLLALLGPLSTTTPFHVIRGYDGATFPAERRSETITHETRFSSSGDGPLSWTTGVFYRDRKDHHSENFLFGFPDSPAPFPFAPTRIDSESWSVFGQAAYALTPRFEVGAGLSYFEDDRMETDLTTNAALSGTFDSLNPRFFVSYDASDGVRLYASAGKGFRSGGFNAGGAAAGRPPYEPDSIWSYEFGTKASLWNGRLRLEAALFYSDYSDVQIESVQLLNQNPQQFTTNSGEAEIRGIDWDLAYSPTDDLSLGFSGDYIDTKMVEINALSSSHAVGDPLDYIPDYHLTFWVMQEFTWFNSADGYARLDYHRQGEMSLTNRTIGPWFFYTSDEIDTLNATVGWRNDERWFVDLYARNVLNERGWLDANWASGHTPRARPREIGIRLGRDF